ncbi:unnamed protein product [Lepeophtheirus salmonis]|uniref:(salmon louse) hypothetical protein n=1 Tax=Lepeophtheirus salmonis TaxID=72036 RepID=A0A0K2TP20_LEPSM|nr:unnamed protein product [Lepeophtheirus salmonis]CAF3028500.1 unnamed protein product [Lepeophtheirus salmonis]
MTPDSVMCGYSIKMVSSSTCSPSSSPSACSYFEDESYLSIEGTHGSTPRPSPALQRLKASVPSISSDEKVVGKLEVILEAIAYIRELQGSLRTSPSELVEH